LEAAEQLVKADQGHWHSAFQEAKKRPELCLAFKKYTEIEKSPAQILHSQKRHIYLSINQ
jgi:hypothetical protein